MAFGEEVVHTRLPVMCIADCLILVCASLIRVSQDRVVQKYVERPRLVNGYKYVTLSGVS